MNGLINDIGKSIAIVVMVLGMAFVGSLLLLDVKDLNDQTYKTSKKKIKDSTTISNQINTVELSDVVRFDSLGMMYAIDSKGTLKISKRYENDTLDFIKDLIKCDTKKNTEIQKQLDSLLEEEEKRKIMNSDFKFLKYNARIFRHI